MAEHRYDRFGLPGAPGAVHVSLWTHEGTRFVALDVATLTAEQARAVARDLLVHAEQIEPIVASRGLSDDFLATIATYYVQAVRADSHPGPAIAARTGSPVRTVHRWVAEARKRGLLAPATRGRVTNA